MGWHKKANAPPTFDQAAAFAALITGDANWGWLADWVPFMPNATFDTEGFCALGPPTVEQLTPQDFTLETASSPFLVAALIAQRTSALAAAARDRVFGAYCEFTTPGTGTWCDLGTASSGPMPVPLWKDFPVPHFQVPVGGSQLRYTVTGTTADGGGIQMIGLNADGSQHFSFQPAQDGQPHVITGQSLTREVYCESHAATSEILFQLEWDCNTGGSGVPIDHVPTAQPEPPGVISPAVNIAPTLDAIAQELGVQEGKLDFLLQHAMQVGALLLPIGLPDAPATTAPAADALVDLTSALGAIIRVSGRPAAVSFIVSNPTNYPVLGWATPMVGDAAAVSIPITHDVSVIRPFPPGTTALSVTMHPPMTATVTPIVPFK